MKEKKRFADGLIELANRRFGLSTDAALKALGQKVPRQESKNL